MNDVPEGFPRLDKTTRPWNCPKDAPGCARKTPCRSCLGKRNRRLGSRGQSEVRRFLEEITGTRPAWNGKKANEESWDHIPIRCEVKSGAQADPVATRYLKSEQQADGAKPIGDPRPFVAAFVPRGMSDPLFVMRQSQLVAIFDAIREKRAAIQSGDHPSTNRKANQ